MWEAAILTTTSHPEKLQSAVCSPARRVLTLTRAWCNGLIFRLPWPPPERLNPTRHILGATRCSPYTALLQEAPLARQLTTASLSEQPLSPTLLSLCMAAVPEALTRAPPLSSSTPHQQRYSDCLTMALRTSQVTSASAQRLRNGRLPSHHPPAHSSRSLIPHQVATPGPSAQSATPSTSPPPPPSRRQQCPRSPSTPTDSSALRHRPPAPSSPSAASRTSSQTQPLPSMARSRRRISFPPVHTPITLQTTT